MRELHLYSYLVEHGLPEGRFRVAQIYVRDLARAMRVSVRTVQRWLRKLEACGLIRTEPTFFDHGGHAANRYLLHGAGLEEETLPETDPREPEIEPAAEAGAGGDAVALSESDLGRVAPRSGEQVEGAASSETSPKGPPRAEKEPPERAPQRGGTVESEARKMPSPIPNPPGPFPRSLPTAGSASGKWRGSLESGSGRRGSTSPMRRSGSSRRRSPR